MTVRIDEHGCLIVGNCALPAAVVPAVEEFYRERFERAGVLAEEPEWEPSAQDLLDAIYNPDEDSENHSVRYGYILEQLERLRGKR